MKTNQERIESINKKVQNKKTQRNIWISCVSAVCVLVIALTVCSVPILGGSEVPNINAYKNDAYYPLISKINSYAYQAEPKISVFQALGNQFRLVHGGNTNNDANEGLIVPTAPGTSVGDGSVASPVPDGSGAITDNSGATSSDGNKYHETTLNQVDGVIEGDILKRSDKNVFYLRNSYFEHADGKDESCLTLDVYNINKNDTELVSAYNIRDDEKVSFYTKGFGSCAAEMYLSDDATTLIVLVQGNAIVNGGYGGDFVTVITLNVSSVTSITEVGRTYVSGKYLSSRKVDDQLLIVTNFATSSVQNIKYGDKSTYVPVCGSDLNSYVPMQNIMLPSDVTDCTYTVIATLDEKTQTVNSQYALFSYSGDIYVSQNNLFAFRAKICPLGSNEYYDYYKNPENRKGELTTRFVTEVTQLSYKNGIEKLSQFCVDGYVKDQYSFDEKDEVLRIVTTTQQTTRRYNNGNNAYYDYFELPNGISASLYCVDIATQKVLGKVERFAPEGETVRSVRFDGDTAYVCTAIEITDPVFAFDLSDYNNIKVKDTGTITGFSVSLIPFGDVLLGIGSGDFNSLKIEAYTQTDSKLVSAGAYKLPDCKYSTEYKAHFIDEKRQLVGLQVYQYRYVTNDPNNVSSKYILLQYDSATQSFTEVAVFPFGGDSWYVNTVDLARAFYCDNGVYVFNREQVQFVDLINEQ